ncbi:MAG: tetratricopeptide repeat protein, partial [Planctomycetota bacterium]
MIRLGIALCLLAGLAPAEERTWAVVMHPVREIRPQEGRVRMLLLPRGSEHGIRKGDRGKLIAVRKGKLNMQTLGYAEVEQVATRVSRVRLTLRSREECRIGDRVEMSTRVPKRPRGILWKLANLDIGLRNASKTHRYYRWEEMRTAETPAGTDALLDEMIALIKQSAKQYAEMEALKKTLASGRYEGRKVGDLMLHVTRAELLDFLNFVVSYPGKYIGQVWRIDEIYATWLLNAAPYSEVELTTKLRATEGTVARRALLGQAPKLRAKVLAQLFSEARDATPDEAVRILEVVQSVRAETDRPAVDIETSYTRGTMARRRREWQSAALAFAETLRIFDTSEGIPDSVRWIETRSLVFLADALKHQGQFKQALSFYDKAMKRQAELGIDAERRATTVRKLADLLRDQGQPRRAIETYAIAIRAFEDLDARKRLRACRAERAKALGGAGRAREAITAYGVLLRQYQDEGNHREEAKIRIQLGVQLRNVGDWMGATREFTAAREIAEKRGFRWTAADACEWLGLVAEGLRNYPLALRYNAAARTHYEELGAERSALIAEGVHGVLEYHAGQREEGWARAQVALRKLGEGNHDYGEIFVRNRIAQLHESRFEYEQARELYSLSVRQAEQSEDTGSLASALRSRATTHALLRSFLAARRDLDRALELLTESGDLDGVAFARLQLARIERSRGRNAVAEEEATRALAFATELGNRRGRADALLERGWSRTARYMPEAAIEDFLEAAREYAHADVADRVGLSTATIARAGTLHDMGRWDEAYTTARQGRVVGNTSGDPGAEFNAAMLLGRIRILRGEYEEAQRDYARVLGAREAQPWQRAEALQDLSVLMRDLGNGGEALRLAREARDQFVALRNPWGEAQSRLKIAALLRERADYEAALAELDAAREPVSRTEDLGTRMALALETGLIALEQGEPEAAWIALERGAVIAEKMGSETLSSGLSFHRGRCLRRLGRDEEARVVLEESVRIFSDMKAVAWEGRARIELVELAMGSPAAAERLAAIEPRLGQFPRDVRWRYWDLRSRVAQEAGELANAFEQRRKAILILSELSANLGADPAVQRRFLLSQVGVYESMAELIGLRIQAETDEAKRQELVAELATFLEQARFEVLRANAAQSGSTVVGELLDEIKELQRRSDSLRKQIDAARAKGQGDLVKRLSEVLAKNEKELGRLFDDLYAQDKDFEARMKFNPKHFRKWKRLPKGASINGSTLIRCFLHTKLSPSTASTKT